MHQCLEKLVSICIMSDWNCVNLCQYGEGFFLVDFPHFFSNTLLYIPSRFQKLPGLAIPTLYFWFSMFTKIQDVGYLASITRGSNWERSRISWLHSFSGIQPWGGQQGHKQWRHLHLCSLLDFGTLSMAPKLCIKTKHNGWCFTTSLEETLAYSTCMPSTHLKNEFTYRVQLNIHYLWDAHGYLTRFTPRYPLPWHHLFNVPSHRANLGTL
jgi:hypothetical protein